MPQRGDKSEREGEEEKTDVMVKAGGTCLKGNEKL